MTRMNVATRTERDLDQDHDLITEKSMDQRSGKTIMAGPALLDTGCRASGESGSRLMRRSGNRSAALGSGSGNAKREVLGARHTRPPYLTQCQIDARDAGWEYRSNSTNAMMARLLASPVMITAVLLGEACSSGLQGRTSDQQAGLSQPIRMPMPEGTGLGE